MNRIALRPLRPLRVVLSLAIAPLLLSLFAAARAQTGKDVWQLMYFDTAKVGFIHVVEEPEVVGGKTQLRRTTDSSLTINRLDTTISMVTANWALEDEKGELLELYSESNMSQAKTIQHLVRTGDRATLEAR